MGDEADLTDELLAAAELLEAVAADRSLLDGLTSDERIRFLNAAGNAFAPDVEARRQQTKARRRLEKAARVERDEQVLTETGIRRLRARPVFVTPDVFPPEDWDDDAVQHTGEEQHCYVCKQKYVQVHHFYDRLCRTCGDHSFAKRTETADLRGRVALLTGGRVKIGYQAGIKLLRAGPSLVVTTRFPRDAALRYSQEPDSEDWRDRLEVYGLDLRHTPSVEALCHHLATTHAELGTSSLTHVLVKKHRQQQRERVRVHEVIGVVVPGHGQCAPVSGRGSRARQPFEECNDQIR